MSLMVARSPALARRMRAVIEGSYPGGDTGTPRDVRRPKIEATHERRTRHGAYNRRIRPIAIGGVMAGNPSALSRRDSLKAIAATVGAAAVWPCLSDHGVLAFAEI